MNRALVAGMALLVLLAGCPLPQPLSDYPAGTVTPPRILMDALTLPQSAIRVPAGCAENHHPSYDLAAELVDNNTSETITVRWFVDYDKQNSAHCTPAVPENVLTGPGDSASDPTRRSVPAYHFVPYDHDSELGGTDPTAEGVVHVVELVVSNSFDPAADQVSLCTASTGAQIFPYRMPASSSAVHFETQTYRWVFVNVPQSATVVCP